VNRGVTRNQTIQKIVETDDAIASIYQDGFGGGTLNLSNRLFGTIQNPSGAQSNLQQHFEDTANLGGCSQFRALCDNFGWVRFKWIEVVLTPETYQALGPNSGQITDNQAQHPVLHYINDDGSSALSLGNGLANIPIVDAEDLPRHAYGTRVFDKPMVFRISPVEKLTASKTSPNYSSHCTWANTNSDPVTGGTQYIPVDGLYLGLTNIPADFTVKIKARACVVAKNMTLDFDLPPPGVQQPASEIAEEKKQQ